MKHQKDWNENTSLGEMFNKFISDMLGILEKDEKKMYKKKV